MKTTVELPDSLFRDAKATASREGLTFKELLTEALRKRVAGSSAVNDEKPWMKAFGGLRHLRAETRRIEKLIEQESEAGPTISW